MSHSATPGQALLIGGTYAVNVNGSDPGLVIQTENVLSNPFVLDLEVGTAQTFDLLDIWTDETWVNKGEDTVKKSGSVDWTFLIPNGSGTSSGETRGYNVFFSIFQGGKIDWRNPTDITLANGAELEIYLSKTVFNAGLFGLRPGRDYAGTVEATFLMTNAGGGPSGSGTDITSIAEPATLGLFGLGIVATGLVGRRRRRSY